MQYTRGDRRYRRVPADIESQVKKYYQLGKGSGTTMISTLNDLLPTRMVDIRVYCQLLKSNLDDFSLSHAWRLRRTNESLEHDYAELQKKYFDFLRADYNVRRKEAIAQGSKVEDFPYLKAKDVPIDGARKYRDSLDVPSVEGATQKCMNALRKKDLRGYDDILNYSRPDFSERFGDDSNGVYDRFTDADWHFINEVCHFVPASEMIRINPAPKDTQSVPMVYSGYARPGN